MTHPAQEETYPPGDTPFAERMDLDPSSITWDDAEGRSEDAQKGDESEPSGD